MAARRARRRAPSSRSRRRPERSNCRRVRPWARSTANSRPRSSSSAARAARMPRKATATASSRSTPVMRKVRSKISTDICLSARLGCARSVPSGAAGLDLLLEACKVGAGLGEYRQHGDAGISEMGAESSPRGASRRPGRSRSRSRSRPRGRTCGRSPWRARSDRPNAGRGDRRTVRRGSRHRSSQ